MGVSAWGSLSCLPASDLLDSESDSTQVRETRTPARTRNHASDSVTRNSVWRPPGRLGNFRGLGARGGLWHRDPTP